jgi:hypothetical protein
MDMNKIKLIYSQKYNQFYKPVRIDEDVGIVYIKVANNRRDKSIQKNEVYQIDEDSKYKFIVIHDANMTAEKHFIETINDEKCSIHIKLGEIRNFKKNMLSESEKAVSILETLASVRGNKGLTDNEIKIRNAALGRYRSLDIWKNTQIEYNRKSYENQIIPNEIMHLALSKRLFIERRDDYCRKAPNTYKMKVAPKEAKHSIQSNFPCGFLIKDKGGYIVAGRSGRQKFTLSVEDVIEFVRNYDVSKTKKYKILYQVPMSEKKEKQLAKCYNILKEYGLHYKNEHNYFFWVLDKSGNVIAGGKNGFGFKWLLSYCRKLKHKPLPKGE